MATPKSKIPLALPKNRCGDVEKLMQAQTKLCERLDEILGCNALLAVIDFTISLQLHSWMLRDEDWDLIAHSGFVRIENPRTGDVSLILMELFRSLFGLAQYFYFCEADIEDTWAVDMHELDIAEHLHNLPQTGDGAHIAFLGSEMGMNATEIFALLEYLYPDGYGAKH